MSLPTPFHYVRNKNKWYIFTKLAKVVVIHSKSLIMYIYIHRQANDVWNTINPTGSFISITVVAPEKYHSDIRDPYIQYAHCRFVCGTTTKFNTTLCRFQAVYISKTWNHATIMFSVSMPFVTHTLAHLSFSMFQNIFIEYLIFFFKANVGFPGTGVGKYMIMYQDDLLSG